MNDHGFDYTPPPSLLPFFKSDARVRFCRGPVGSSKSTAMVMELFRRACEQKPGKDGKRRTRFAIIRNTLPQIRETCLATIKNCLNPLLKYKVSEQKIYIEFNDVSTEWLMLPLDTPDNIQKLLSLELTGAWVSEAREIDPEIVHNVLSRCGRYPSRITGGCTWYGVVCESNSFSQDSPWYEQLEVDPPSNWAYFIQPGARDPKADWLQYLPPDYYNDLIASNSDDWVDQYVDNKIGPSLSGQAVWHKSFDYNFHVTDSIHPDVLRPMVIGLDVGRNPAAVIGQQDIRGRLLVCSSVWAENMGLERFVGGVLRPHMAEVYPRGGKFFACLDPSARAKSQVSEESVLQAMQRLGYNAILASTNAVAPRLRAVERFMQMQVGGGPGFLVARQHNSDLLVAIQSKYRYPRNKSGELTELPEKNHPASDLCDGLQYLALGVHSNALARELAPPRKPAAPLAAAAWT